MSGAGRVTDNPPHGSQTGAARHSGHVVLRLAQRHTHDAESLREVAQQENFRALDDFLRKRPDLVPRRLLRHAPPAAIREREQQAGQGAFVPMHSLTAYWRIDARAESDSEALRKTLHDMPEVAVAYHESAVVEAAPGFEDAGDNPYFHEQGFLNGRPQGIGAAPAWALAPGGGGAVNVIDLEAGWILDHQDLPRPEILYGDNGAATAYVSGDHGAAVMGVIAALNNRLGGIGIAPRIGSLNAVSHYDRASSSGLHVADAIGAALRHLQAGDILLLEVQRSLDGSLWPTEVDSADLHAIRLAVAHGIIVVEAAGNGTADLDSWCDPTGQHCLQRGAPAFVDSGAIVVGAAASAVTDDPAGHAGHERYYSSNYGSRVDVHAWGENICTAGYGRLAGTAGKGDSYTAGFGQTSGASAIIAGAAALLQSWRIADCGTPFTPPELRALLTEPGTSTPQAQVAGKPVGVMPDVAAIIRSVAHPGS